MIYQYESKSNNVSKDKAKNTQMITVSKSKSNFGLKSTKNTKQINSMKSVLEPEQSQKVAKSKSSSKDVAQVNGVNNDNIAATNKKLNNGDITTLTQTSQESNNDNIQKITETGPSNHLENEGNLNPQPGHDINGITNSMQTNENGVIEPKTNENKNENNVTTTSTSRTVTDIINIFNTSDSITANKHVSNKITILGNNTNNAKKTNFDEINSTRHEVSGAKQEIAEKDVEITNNVGSAADKNITADSYDKDNGNVEYVNDRTDKNQDETEEANSHKSSFTTEINDDQQSIMKPVTKTSNEENTTKEGSIILNKNENDVSSTVNDDNKNVKHLDEPDTEIATDTIEADDNCTEILNSNESIVTEM